MVKYKRRFGDRYDGRRIRSGDPLFHLIPKIMRTRLDSQVFFDEQIDLEPLEKYVYKKRAEGMKNLRIIHVITAAMVRVVSQRPQINRFVSGKKIYARNYLRFALTIKKSMTRDAEEAIIQTEFDRSETVDQVAEKMDLEIKREWTQSDRNNTDIWINAFKLIPGLIISFIVFIARNIDKIGLLPKVINKVSPFHSSVFIVDIGSLGLRPVYHHLYEFGTCSVFVCIGKKEYVPTIVNGELKKKRIIGVRFVIDERITDGFYNASIIKMFLRLLKNPENLEIPPESIIEDEDLIS